MHKKCEVEKNSWTVRQLCVQELQTFRKSVSILMKFFPRSKMLIILQRDLG